MIPGSEALASQLGGRKTGNGSFLADCPSCGYKRALTIREGERGALFYCHAGCDQTELLQAVRELQGANWQTFPPRARTRAPKRDAAAEAARTKAAAELWARTIQASGTVVERYLRARGFTGPIPGVLRLLQDAAHHESGQRLSAMVARVDAGFPRRGVAVHRTFLTDTGEKAQVLPAKKTLGPLRDGATVRLAPAAEEMAIGEGIETCLAVLGVTGTPTWCALSAGGLERAEPPPLPMASSVIVCVDHDTRGIEAGNRAAERWTSEGRTVRIAIPEEQGDDFNDVLLGRASRIEEGAA